MATKHITPACGKFIAFIGDKDKEKSFDAIHSAVDYVERMTKGNKRKNFEHSQEEIITFWESKKTTAPPGLKLVKRNEKIVSFACKIVVNKKRFQKSLAIKQHGLKYAYELALAEANKAEAFRD